MLRLSARPSVITRADRAREAKQWDVAARHYRKALSRNPRRPPIWIQYGHALKESGNLAEAEAAYRRALSCDPAAEPASVADSHLHLGRVLKLQGKTEEAKAAFLRALMHDRLSTEPLRELARLGWSESALAELAHWASIRPDGALTSSPDLASFPESILLVASRLFDAGYYREQNPDVNSSQFDPLAHYLTLGYKEGRSFHPLFNVAYYMKSRGAMARSKNPLIDFITTPVKARANPIPFFDPEYYRSMYDDIGENDTCPFEHFLVHGRHEPHRSINWLFSHE